METEQEDGDNVCSYFGLSFMYFILHVRLYPLIHQVHSHVPIITSLLTYPFSLLTHALTLSNCIVHA